LARHNFSSVFRTIYLRVRFFISAFFEANWEIKFLFLYSGVLPKFISTKKLMPYRARSMQEKKIRLYPLIATFSDSSCKQSKPQTTKTTQNKLIQKFCCESSSFAHYSENTDWISQHFTKGFCNFLICFML